MRNTRNTKFTNRRVGSYPRAIAFLIYNDCVEWLNDDEPKLSVSAALVASVFERTPEEVIADMRKMIAVEKDRDANAERAQQLLEQTKEQVRAMLNRA